MSFFSRCLQKEIRRVVDFEEKREIGVFNRYKIHNCTLMGTVGLIKNAKKYLNKS